MGCPETEMVRMAKWDYDMSVLIQSRKVDVEKVDTGETFSDEADVIVSARGGLNEYLWPQIDGLWPFGGKIVHSATWDQS